MGFLLFHVGMEAKERKNVATCMFSTSYFQAFGFFRHENQSDHSAKGIGASGLYCLFFGWIHKVFNNEKSPSTQCGEITVMISSCSFNCWKINEGKSSQLLESEDQPRTEQQKGSPSRDYCQEPRSPLLPQSGLGRAQGGRGTGGRWHRRARRWEAWVLAFRVGMQTDWPGGASLWTSVSLLKLRGVRWWGNSSTVSTLRSVSWVSGHTPCLWEEKKCPNLTLRASAH